MTTLDSSVQGSSVSSFQDQLMGAEDPMGMLTGSSAGRGSLGEDASKGQRVELALCWGPTLLELHHLEAEDAAFSIGDLEHPLPNAEASQALVSSDQGSLRVHLDPAWTHNLSQVIDLGDTLEAELLEGQQLIAIAGEFTLVIRQVSAARKVVGKKKLDVPFIGVTAFSAFMAAMLGVLAWNAPPTQNVTTVEVSEAVAQIFLNPPEEPKTQIKSTPAADKEGKKHEGEEGRIGRKEARMKNASGNPVEGRERDREFVKDKGIFGALADSGVADMMGGGIIDAGLGQALGMNAGPKGVQIGVGGYSGKGIGPGGGGEVGSLNMGQGLRGDGNGLRDYEGQGLGTKATMSLPTQKETIILGSLDRSQVDAVIKRNLSKFRYCYQRELTKDPGLGGKVTVKFTIAKDGQVSAAKTKASSVSNSAVEGCLNKTMMKLKFPAPKGEGIVIVSYPFLFAPG